MAKKPLPKPVEEEEEEEDQEQEQQENDHGDSPVSSNANEAETEPKKERKPPKRRQGTAARLDVVRLQGRQRKPSLFKTKHVVSLTTTALSKLQDILGPGGSSPAVNFGKKYPSNGFRISADFRAMAPFAFQSVLGSFIRPAIHIHRGMCRDLIKKPTREPRPDEKKISKSAQQKKERHLDMMSTLPIYVAATLPASPFPTTLVPIPATA